MLMAGVTIKLNIDIDIWISGILFCFSCLFIKLSKRQNVAMRSLRKLSLLLFKPIDQGQLLQKIRSI